VNPNAAFIKGLQWAAVSRVVMEDLFAGTGKKHPTSSPRSARR